MKILHFDLAGSFRGGQKQALLLHRGLLDRGVESHFLARSKGGLIEIARRDNIDNIHSAKNATWGPPLLRRLLIFRSVKRTVARIKPDILHFHESGSVIYGALFSDYLSCETRRISSPIRDRSVRYKYRKIDAHVGVSDYVSALLREKGLPNVHTIPSCIELTRFQSVVPKDLKNKKAFNFLYLGSMAEMKGIDILLKAFAGLCQERSDVALHLVGSGPEFDNYQHLSKTLGIGDTTEFYRFVTDVESYYPAVDLVIVPSRRAEGSNGVIKEALASGKPVLASDFAPNLEIVNDGSNGIMFENENISDLLVKMKNFLDGKYQIDPAIARQSVEKFSSDRMVDAYLQLYKSMIGT